MRVYTKDLAAALKAVRPCLSATRYFPNISHVHLKREGDLLVLTTTNLETSAQAVITVDGLDSTFDAVCLPYNALEAITLGGGGDLAFSGSDKGPSFVTIASAGGVNHLAGMDTDDYPSLDWPQEIDLNDWPVKTITADINTMSAVASSKDRYNMNCIWFDGESRRLVSTDGHRIRYQAVDWLPSGVKGLIDSRELKRSVSCLKNSCHSGVTVTATEKTMIFRSHNLTVMVRISEGDYPELGFTGNIGEIPTGWFARKDLERALKQTKVCLTMDRVHVDGVDIAFRLGRVILSVTNHDLCSGRVEIPAYIPQEVLGLNLLINHNYLTNAARSYDGPDIPVQWQGNMIVVGNEIICRMKTADEIEAERKAA